MTRQEHCTCASRVPTGTGENICSSCDQHSYSAMGSDGQTSVQ